MLINHKTWLQHTYLNLSLLLLNKCNYLYQQQHPSNSPPSPPVYVLIVRFYSAYTTVVVQLFIFSGFPANLLFLSVCGHCTIYNGRGT